MRKYFLIACIFFRLNPVLAQGCSDAGFCTAGALHPITKTGDTVQPLSKTLSVSFTLGAGEQNTTIFIPQLEWIQQLSSNVRLEAKLPLYLANGNIGSHSGVGDPIVTLSNILWKVKSWTLRSTAGLRVSLGDANAGGADARPLPMPYQSNLGTTDIIAGLSLNWKRYLSIAAGLQQPVFQYNNNDYDAVNYASDPQGYGAYFSSRKLRRRGDILLRADGSYQLKRWHISAGPLFIVHLGEDRITNSNGQEIKVKGSDGATLNITGTVGYHLKRSAVELAAGSPVAVREVRPDGLTRSSVLTLRYSYSLR